MSENLTYHFASESAAYQAAAELADAGTTVHVETSGEGATVELPASEADLAGTTLMRHGGRLADQD